MRHIYSHRVPFGDVDAVGIVYFARLFHYFHLAYESYFHDGLGVPFQEYFQRMDVLAPLVHAEADYRRRLREGDLLSIECGVIRFGRRSWTWRFVVSREDAVAATGTLVMSFVRGVASCDVPDAARKLRLWEDPPSPAGERSVD